MQRNYYEMNSKIILKYTINYFYYKQLVLTCVGVDVVTAEKDEELMEK